MNITITYIKAEKYYNDCSHTYSILFESIVPELQYIIPPHAVATVPPAIITTRAIFLGGRKNFRHLGKFCELNLGVIFVKVWLLRKFDPCEENNFPSRRQVISFFNHTWMNYELAERQPLIFNSSYNGQSYLAIERAVRDLGLVNPLTPTCNTCLPKS